MKAWVGQAIFAATVVGTVGAVGLNTIINTNNIEPEIVVESTDMDTDALISPDSTEIAPEDSAIPEESTTEEPQATTPTATPQGSVTVEVIKPSKPASSYPTTPTYKYSYVGDFEQAFMGYCPQDVPEGMWGDKLNPAVALGYSTTSGDKSPEAKIRNVWGTFKTQNFYELYGDNYKVGWTSMFGIDTGGSFNGSVMGDNIAFILHWSTKTVTWERLWDDSPSKDYWPADMRAQFDDIATRMTHHLRYLDNAYTAKCGY